MRIGVLINGPHGRAGRRDSRSLNRPNVRGNRMGIVTAKPKHGHILMTSQQAPAQSIRKGIEIQLSVQNSEGWSGHVRTGIVLPDRMTAATHLPDEYTSLLLERRALGCAGRSGRSSKHNQCKCDAYHRTSDYLRHQCRNCHGGG